MLYISLQNIQGFLVRRLVIYHLHHKLYLLGNKDTKNREQKLPSILRLSSKQMNTTNKVLSFSPSENLKTSPHLTRNKQNKAKRGAQRFLSQGFSLYPFPRRVGSLITTVFGVGCFIRSEMEYVTRKMVSFAMRMMFLLGICDALHLIYVLIIIFPYIWSSF